MLNLTNSRDIQVSIIHREVHYKDLDFGKRDLDITVRGVEEITQVHEIVGGMCGLRITEAANVLKDGSSKDLRHGQKG